MALLLLEADGLLALDDDVRLHVPELPDFGTPVTLRHFLNYTSGYREIYKSAAARGLSRRRLVRAREGDSGRPAAAGAADAPEHRVELQQHGLHPPVLDRGARVRPAVSGLHAGARVRAAGHARHAGQDGAGRGDFGQRAAVRVRQVGDGLADGPRPAGLGGRGRHLRDGRGLGPLGAQLPRRFAGRAGRGARDGDRRGAGERRHDHLRPRPGNRRAVGPHGVRAHGRRRGPPRLPVLLPRAGRRRGGDEQQRVVRPGAGRADRPRLLRGRAGGDGGRGASGRRRGGRRRASRPSARECRRSASRPSRARG